METSTQLRRRIAAALFAAAFASLAMAADIGQIKVAKGPVTIERDGRMLPAAVGMRVQTADVVTTGADASVGITMGDNSLLSAGPNSTLLLERYEFDATTSRGRFDASLSTGSLAVVSGRIAKQSPEAMTVRTPFAILGVRGTEFVVSAHAPTAAPN
ncbi:MAG: FecR domain-containing protein [Betaproteobacteria bacterium]|nr:FecR domain-containing protein [Betaproteobacteria bacterium]